VQKQLGIWGANPEVKSRVSGAVEMKTRTSPEIFSAEILARRAGVLAKRQSDFLAREEPLEIRVRGRSVAVTMRSPGHDAELAAGFLLTEGVLHRAEDVVEIAHCQQGEAVNDQNVLNVFLSPSVEVDLERLTRHVFASSSCGLCGKASIEAVQQHFPPVESPLVMTSRTLLALPKRLRAGQDTFRKTGGLHAAAVFDRRGRLVVLREDVGRHNAVDKVIGWGFLGGALPFDRRALMVSGRASFEIMQKALAARIPIVCAVSAPSSLAVEFARESNQTLVGFLRDDSFNVYSHPDRISDGQSRRVLKGKREARRAPRQTR
jgi:FdhD protein